MKFADGRIIFLHRPCKHCRSGKHFDFECKNKPQRASANFMSPMWETHASAWDGDLLPMQPQHGHWNQWQDIDDSGYDCMEESAASYNAIYSDAMHFHSVRQTAAGQYLHKAESSGWEEVGGCI